MKFGFVAKHRGVWPVVVQCEALGVSRSGFYVWCDRPESTRARTDAEILRTIRASFVLSDSTYGARRMIDEVRDSKHACGLRPCRAAHVGGAALRARPRRRALPSRRNGHPRDDRAENVLDRAFTATAPNQKWVADFTYIWTSEGWLYVAAVLDLFSRRVVGWSMQTAMTSELVTDALMMAVWRTWCPTRCCITRIKGASTRVKGGVSTAARSLRHRVQHELAPATAGIMR